MHMPMIYVRKVRMLVIHGDVLMRMVVRCCPITIEIEIVRVLVMPVVVVVLVRMRHSLMRVVMLVVLGQMKPDAQSHQHCCAPEQRRRRFTEQRQ